MRASTLTADQQELRARVMEQIGFSGGRASTALLDERANGAPAGDVAAVADDLCAGAGDDYR